MKKMKLAFTVLLLLLLVACSGNIPDISQALKYDTVKTEDNSFPGRKRVWHTIYIKNGQPSFEERKQTLVKAALDIEKANHAEVVVVWAVCAPDAPTFMTETILGRATYIPDGKGLSGEDSSPVWTLEVAKDTPAKEQIILSKAVASSSYKGLCKDIPANECYAKVSQALDLPMGTRPAFLKYELIKID